MSDLFAAILEGSLKKIKQYVQHNIHTINVRERHHTPPSLTVLHGCVKLSELTMLKYLVKTKKEILLDARVPTENDGMTPLHSACAVNDYSMARYLLTLNGVVEDVRQRDKEGITPVLSATKWSNMQLIKVLCKHGAQVHIHGDLSGQTPMLVAVSSGDRSLVKLLIGIDIEQRSGTSTSSSSSNNNSTTTSSSSSSSSNNNSTTSTSTSSSNATNVDGSVSTVNNRSMVRAANHEGWTPFLLACAGNHINIMRMLFNNGANEDIDTPNKHGATPMKYSVAAGTSHMQIVRQLQRYGVPLLDCTTARLGFFTTASGLLGQSDNNNNNGSEQNQSACNNASLNQYMEL